MAVCTYHEECQSRHQQNQYLSNPILHNYQIPRRQNKQKRVRGLHGSHTHSHHSHFLFLNKYVMYNDNVHYYKEVTAYSTLHYISITKYN